jgi:hypothetical protein
MRQRLDDPNGQGLQPLPALRQAAAVSSKEAGQVAPRDSKDVQRLRGILYSHTAATDGDDLRQRIMQESRKCRKVSPP